MAKTRPPPKHWHVWRSGFWLRPVFVLVLGMLAAAAGVVVVALLPARIGRLDGGDIVDALVWRDEVVAFETASGDRVETEEYGHRGWALQLGTGLFLVALGAIGVKTARVKRRLSDSWWSTSAPPAGMLEPSPPTLLMAALFFTACALIISLALGASVGWSFAIAVATAGALGALAVLVALRLR